MHRQKAEKIGATSAGKTLISNIKPPEIKDLQAQAAPIFEALKDLPKLQIAEYV